MTSRSYTKSYSRKVNSVTPGSIQFDKLFRENSNRPSAAKSAGTVGKWGITSFTSIRSTNINGRRDDIHRTFGAKKPKLDYGNQNAQLTTTNQDPFSFDTTEPIDSTKNDNPAPSQLPKPKKFFKSRNAPAPQVSAQDEATRQDAAIYRQVPESQYGRSTTPATATTTTRAQKNPSTKQSHQPKQVSRKMSESLDGSSSDTSTRDDGKPPIVLRICKGTASIVSGDNQEAAKIDDTIVDNELETYRITTPVTSPTKSSPDRKSYSPDVVKVEQKSLKSSHNYHHQQQYQYQAPIVTTVSIPLDSTDVPNRRTTRSRAKNLNIDLSSGPIIPSLSSPQPPTTPNPQSSGLSLTLRKSITDSNNTSISHYDIVKTDCSTNYSNRQGINEQNSPLPTATAAAATTTQELLDILSSDNEPRKNIAQHTTSDDEEEEEEEDEEDDDEEEEYNENDTTINIAQNKSVKDCSIDLPIVQNAQSYNEQEPESESDYNDYNNTNIVANKLETVNNHQQYDGDKDVAKTLVDQDWSSGSEDNESLSGNQDIEMSNCTPMDIATDHHDDNQQLKQQPQQLQREQRVQENDQHQHQELSAMPETKNLTIKPATKKGSIFKSRSTGATNGSNKRLALYKHKWCDNEKESTNQDDKKLKNSVQNPSCSGQNKLPSNETFGFDEELETSELTRVVTYPETNMDFDDDTAEAITSIRCGKKVKGFYTVVKNVKKAHQIQESGEFQEFNDDVDYILDTLRENNPNATRCLSAIRLASKCMAPAFRMHVRAHGTVAKFFKALHDATKDQSLGLCTATVMFVLSQDRLAMDLDRDCLELMLSLLECDASHKNALDDCGLSSAELLKNKEKVRQICADIQSQGHAKHLNLDNITVGQLAMETLLSLTSKRAGEWFKEELRELGGLEHIVNTIKDCHKFIIINNLNKITWTDLLLDKLRKVDRCLRVLENVTYRNEENQIYLLKYGDGLIVKTLANLYIICGNEIPIYPTIDVTDKCSTGAVIRECIFAILIVLINLTHRFNQQSFGSRYIGGENGVLDCTLNLLLRVANELPEEKSFEMMMLSLSLLINFVEQCNDNKKLLMQSKAPPLTNYCHDSSSGSPGGGVEALIDLFYKQEELAQGEEQKTDAILDGKKDSEQTETASTTTKSQEEFVAETVAKLLQKAGRHMEHHFIGANVVILLGHLIMDNKEYEMAIREKLPGNNFGSMVAVLQKYFNFMNLTASNEIIATSIATTEKVIKFLKLSDARAEEEKNELPLPALEDSSIMLDLSSS